MCTSVCNTYTGYPNNGFKCAQIYVTHSNVYRLRKQGI